MASERRKQGRSRRGASRGAGVRGARRTARRELRRLRPVQLAAELGQRCSSSLTPPPPPARRAAGRARATPATSRSRAGSPAPRPSPPRRARAGSGTRSPRAAGSGSRSIAASSSVAPLGVEERRLGRRDRVVRAALLGHAQREPARRPADRTRLRASFATIASSQGRNGAPSRKRPSAACAFTKASCAASSASAAERVITHAVRNAIV